MTILAGIAAKIVTQTDEQREKLDGVGALFAGADAYDAVNVGHPDLAVTDLASGGRSTLNFDLPIKK